MRTLFEVIRGEEVVTLEVEGTFDGPELYIDSARRVEGGAEEQLSPDESYGAVCALVDCERANAEWDDRRDEA